MDNTQANVQWAVSLGGFRSKNAVKTLPMQLEMLRYLADVGDPELALAWRLVIGAGDPSVPGWPDSRLHLECRYVGDPDPLAADRIQWLKDFAGATLVPGFSIGTSSGDRDTDIWRDSVRVVPVESDAPLPVTGDWAQVIDVLRHEERACAVDLVVRVRPDAAPSTPVSTFGPAVAVDRATTFFRRVRKLAGGGPLLDLDVVMHDSQPDQVGVWAVSLARIITGVPALRVCDRNEHAATFSGPPELIVRAWHAPYGSFENRGFEGQGIRLSLRGALPVVAEEQRAAVLGEVTVTGARSDERVDVTMNTTDRMRHIYLLGKTGSGKTNLMMNVVAGDIHGGHGVAVFDPHGPLVEHALAQAAAAGREDDVILLDFTDPEALPQVNPLTVDTDNDPLVRLNAVDDVMEVIRHASYEQFTGPRFQETVEMWIETAYREEICQDLGPSIALALALGRSANARGAVANRLQDTDTELSARWQLYNNMRPEERAEVAHWASAKFSDFTRGSPLQQITSGQDSPLSFDDIATRNRLLLVNLAPTRGLTVQATRFLGSWLFQRIYRALRNRPSDDSHPFYIHIDEFQNYVSWELEELVAEARKFNVGLTLAHQNMQQLVGFSAFEASTSDRLAQAVFANVGTLIAMKMSGKDQAVMAAELALKEVYLRRMRQYDAVARIVVDGQERGPMTLSPPQADTDQAVVEQARQRVKDRMIRQEYWAMRTDLEMRVNRIHDRAARFTESRPKPRRGGQADPGTHTAPKDDADLLIRTLEEGAKP